jgi:penicillin amidase
MRAFSLPAVTAVLFVGAVAPVLAGDGDRFSAPLRLPELSGPAWIVRDADGMPHIHAPTERDALFLQGWITAHDRLFQIDVSRRQGSGTLAELLGPGALGSDVELRTIGLRRAAERSWQRLSPEARAGLQAYADGINAWVKRNPLPPQYAAVEITKFEPWSPVDSVVVGKALAFSLSFDIDVDPTIQYLTYTGVGQAAGFNGDVLFFSDMMRSQPFSLAATVPDATGSPPFIGGLGSAAAAAVQALGAGGAARLATPQNDSSLDLSSVAAPSADPTLLRLAREYRERISGIEAFRPVLERSEKFIGSNEWAVAGWRTRDGRPLVANDPHLRLGTPATFHQIHLQTYRGRERLDVIGSGVPGAPWVILGQNRHITWGATTTGYDVTDTYREQIAPDPRSPSGLSIVHQGALEPIIPVPLAFRYNVLDGAPDTLSDAAPGAAVAGVSIPPVALTIPRRNDGPIVNLDLAAGTAISIQYMGFSGTRELDMFRRANFARGLRDFRAALQFFDVGSQNFVYGDVEGNIAYFTTGEIPLREDLQAGTVNGAPPWFIRDGRGGNEWLRDASPATPERGTPFQSLPFEEMPQTVNPKNGWFVNANNDPSGATLDNNPLNQLRPSGSGIYYLGYTFDYGSRAGRATQALKEALARGRVGRNDMRRIQADVVLLDAQVLTPHILRAFENAATSDAPALLKQLAGAPGVAEAIDYLSHWNYTAPTGVREGYDAADRNGRLSEPTEEEIRHSIAATLYSVWRSRIIRNSIDATLDGVGRLAGIPNFPKPGSGEALKALKWLLERDGLGACGLDFFGVPGIASAAARRDAVILKSLNDVLGDLSGDAYASAFARSTNLRDYRWGKLHRIVFGSVLPPFSTPPQNLPPSFANLTGIATDGGFGVVDASSHSARASGANGFVFGSGPARRYVGSLGHHPGDIEGETILPGGMVDLPGNRFAANLLPRWLTNEYYRLRQDLGEVWSGAAQVDTFLPAR